MKVLIVDDEKNIASMLQDYMELNESCEVEVAHSGYEALAIIKERKPDLIILDIVMPGMNGYELMDALKSQAQTAMIPIILSSALEEISPAQKEELGVLDFLPKPINLSKLNRMVSMALSPYERFFGTWQECA